MRLIFELEIAPLSDLEIAPLSAEEEEEMREQRRLFALGVAGKYRSQYLLIRQVPPSPVFAGRAAWEKYFGPPPRPLDRPPPIFGENYPTPYLWEQMFEQHRPIWLSCSSVTSSSTIRKPHRQWPPNASTILPKRAANWQRTRAQTTREHMRCGRFDWE